MLSMMPQNRLQQKKQALFEENFSEAIGKSKELGESLKCLDIQNNGIEKGNAFTYDTHSVSETFKNFF